MKSLFIAIGNPLRRDDGVAHEVVGRLKDAETRAVLQLTPEMAAEIADYDVVVFIDADTSAADVRLEPLESRSAPSISHVMSPAAIVGLAREVFGFAGEAHLCRIPVDDLSAGIGLSERALANAGRAADAVWNM